MILIGYDGSTDARAAIDRIAALMPGSPATVVAVWKSFEPSIDYHGGLEGAFTDGGPLGHRPQDVDIEALDRRLEEAARAKASEGAGLATKAGLRAEPRVARQHASVADAIIDLASELDASAIVLGSRGRTAARTWFMGSVSHAALQHADRPVIVVPSSEVAGRRAEHRRQSAGSGSSVPA